MGPPKVRTCLYLERGGYAAASFYVSLLPGGQIETVHGLGNAADPMVVEFTLAAAPMMILTDGPMFRLSPAVSSSGLTKGQAEADRLWAALTPDGGAGSMCGWRTDRFGVSWQITPGPLMQMNTSPDLAAAGRARAGMMSMRKIEIAALEAVFAG